MSMGNGFSSVRTSEVGFGHVLQLCKMFLHSLIFCSETNVLTKQLQACILFALL